jgi:hydrophobic/amphiphilic exporter-1 (mainly G- bacteria), HAE1 family
MKIAEISIRRPVFALMMMVALVVFGVFSYPRVGVDLYPNVEFPFATVVVVYPGADPVSMEDKVAKPIEDALSSMSGIKLLMSQSRESVTLVMIQFELSVDRDQAVQDVRDRISAIQALLPSGIEPPTIQKMDVGAIPIMSVALSGNLPPRDLTELADDFVKERIQRIEGVGNVEVVGGRRREIHVEIDPGNLAARGLTPGDVAMALQGQNLDLPAGVIEEGRIEYVVTTKGAFESVDEIAGAPIVSGGGFAVRIGDVAVVRDDMAEKRSHASIDGEPAVALVVQKTSGANTVAVAEAINAELAAIEQDLAARGARLTIVGDLSPYVVRNFHEVQFDLLLGGLLAVIIVLGFLRDWRATFIAALALPTSVIATVWFLNIMGFTFNMMTMLALSLSIGLLIDDAIVVIENIHRHLEMGKPARQAAFEGTKEIGLAVLATTFSIVAVFAPVATMEGIVGRFFWQFGLTVSVAVLVSLFVSFTLTPMMSSRMLRQAHGRRSLPFRAIEWLLTRIERLYRGILAAALRHRALTLLAAGGLLVGSCVLAGQVEQTFFPEEDRSLLSIDIELPTGTSLPTTTEVIERIAADVRAHAPGVDNTYVRIGGGAQGQVNIGKIQVTLIRPSQRSFTQQHLMEWARARYAPLAERGLQIAVNQVDEMGGDSGFKTQQIQYNLRGRDMDELIAVAEQVKAAMLAHGGFVDVDSTYRGGKPQLEITPRRGAAAELAVPTAQIGLTLRALASRDKVTEFKDGTEIYDVKLTLAEEVEAGLASLANLQVRSTTGDLVALSSVVDVQRGLGPSQIDRQARMRQITVLANLEGLSLGAGIAKVDQFAKQAIAGKDIVTDTAGEAQIMEESMGYMIVALILAIILVYMILAAQFESLIHPFTIMLSLPLAVVGAFGALFLAGHAMSIFAMIGLIMLMGLVTKNAILLVDYANRKKAEGLSTIDALLVAGPIRLRPILMTTAAMIFGMLPVALALGEGGEVRAPMAIVVIGGLITSTLLTLVVVPVVYSLFEGLADRLWRRRRKVAAAAIVQTIIGG